MFAAKICFKHKNSQKYVMKSASCFLKQLEVDKIILGVVLKVRQQVQRWSGRHAVKTCPSHALYLH
jgi:hypothetical protein